MGIECLILPESPESASSMGNYRESVQSLSTICGPGTLRVLGKGNICNRARLVPRRQEPPSDYPVDQPLLSQLQALQRPLLSG